MKRSPLEIFVATEQRPRLERWGRSVGVAVTVRLLGWVSEYVRYADVDHPIGWRDHVRWYLEGVLAAAFAACYAGSDEELEAVVNDDIPDRYLSRRQQFYRFWVCLCAEEARLSQGLLPEHAGEAV